MLIAGRIGGWVSAVAAAHAALPLPILEHIAGKAEAVNSVEGASTKWCLLRSSLQSPLLFERQQRLRYLVLGIKPMIDTIQLHVIEPHI